MASRAKAGSKKSEKDTLTDPAPKPSLAGIVEEVVVRGGAVRFYVVGVTENSTGVFLTQNEGTVRSSAHHFSYWVTTHLQRVREPLMVLPIKLSLSAEKSTHRLEQGQLLLTAVVFIVCTFRSVNVEFSFLTMNRCFQ